MLNRLIFAFLTVCTIACASFSSAQAQVFIVSSCGTVPASQATLTPGNPGMFFIDTTGTLCTSSGGGGAGGATSANQTNGNQQVQGNVANGATDAGNPVKVGGVYNTTLPTLTAGQRGDMQVNANGVVRSQPVLNSAAAADAQSNTIGFFQQSGTAGANSFLLGAAANYLSNGSTWDRTRSINAAQSAGTGTQAVAIAPTSAAAAGITPVVTGAAANNLVLKASAGNLYSAYATNLTATAGFLMVLNATSAPADGAVAPLECVPLPANGTAVINYNSGPPGVFSTGITAVVSSATTCFTKTTGTITAFIKGAVQ